VENLKKVTRNEAMNVAVIKKNLVAVKGPQVAVVFARSGIEGLQGSGNTARCMCSNRSNGTPRSMDFSFSPIGNYALCSCAVLYYSTRDSL
jgi:hypothetical protein